MGLARITIGGGEVDGCAVSVLSLVRVVGLLGTLFGETARLAGLMVLRSLSSMRPVGSALASPVPVLASALGLVRLARIGVALALGAACRVLEAGRPMGVGGGDGVPVGGGGGGGGSGALSSDIRVCGCRDAEKKV